MKHKDSNLIETENRVLTPKDVEKALENLPFNYIKLVIILLEQQLKQGKIEKTYTGSYISKVRNSQGDAFNEDVMNAIVQVGIAHLEKRNLFGSKKKKTSKTN